MAASSSNCNPIFRSGEDCRHSKFNTLQDIAGLGYTDCSDAKNRGYFMSVYFRTPGGALFEAAYTLQNAFMRDEPYDTLGTVVQMPPWLMDRRDEVLARLEPIAY